MIRNAYVMNMTCKCKCNYKCSGDIDTISNRIRNRTIKKLKRNM